MATSSAYRRSPKNSFNAKPDLIFAVITHAAVAASHVTKTTPIVCPLLADPVRLGLIKNDARPGGAVTGLRFSVDGLPSKQLELVLDLNPGATKIGLLVNPDNAHSLSQRQELETAVAAKAIKIATIEARDARRRRFDLPDAGERTGRRGYLTSGHTVLHPTRKIGGVGNGSTVADRVGRARGCRGRRPDQLRGQPTRRTFGAQPVTSIKHPEGRETRRPTGAGADEATSLSSTSKPRRRSGLTCRRCCSHARTRLSNRPASLLRCEVSRLARFDQSRQCSNTSGVRGKRTSARNCRTIRICEYTPQKLNCVATTSLGAPCAVTNWVPACAGTNGNNRVVFDIGAFAQRVIVARD